MNNQYTTDSEIEQMQTELEEYIGKCKKYQSERRRLFMQKAGRIFFWFVFVFCMILLINIWSSKAVGKTPTLFGYQIYQVETESMVPTFPVGTRILSKVPEDAADLKEGTIVTFTAGGETITHRIVEVVNTDGQTRYRTKGDNPKNSEDPELLKPGNVLAVYQYTLPF